MFVFCGPEPAPDPPWPRHCAPPLTRVSDQSRVRLMIGQTRVHQMWHSMVTTAPQVTHCHEMWWDPVWSVRSRCWWAPGGASLVPGRPGPGRGWTRRLAELSPSRLPGIISQITRDWALSASTMSVSPRESSFVKYSMFNYSSWGFLPSR